MAGAVFVSYRRGSASGSAGRIYDVLTARFGEQSIFMDVDNIAPGESFIDVLTSWLKASQAVIVVIDPAWAWVRDRNGRRRLDNPKDFVRLEIETALRDGLRIIPVLVDGAQMPDPGDLPSSIAGLSFRQAIEISPTRFRYDAGRLLSALEMPTRQRAPVPPIPKPKPLSQSAIGRSALATVGERVFARLIDGAIFGVLYFALTMLLTLTQQIVYNPTTGEFTNVGPLTPFSMFPPLVSGLIYTAYDYLMHARDGQTLGKKAMRTRLVNKIGGTPAHYALVLRSAIYPGSIAIASLLEFTNTEEGFITLAILGFSVIDLLFIVANSSRRRALHDWVSGGTLVVKA